MNSATRESGVQFLGKIPSHWEVRPAVTLAEVLTSTVDKKTYDGEIAVKLCNYTDVYYGNEIVDDSKFMAATASVEQIAKFSVRGGDVPFTKDSETADDIGIPAFVPNDLPGVVYGYHLSIYRPKDRRRGRFLRYLLESDYAKAQFEAKTPGVTRVGLSQTTIRSFRMPTPPVNEAVAIADYLDRETARIDAFIAKNEELVSLLTERKQAAIDSRLAVAGGAYVSLQRVLSRIRQGWSPVCESSPADGVSEWGVLKVGCSNTGRFDPFENKKLPESEYPRADLVVARGEIVMSRSNTRELVGTAAVVSGNYPKLMLSDLTYGITVGPEILPEFLAWQLRGGFVRAQIEAAAKGSSSSMQKLSKRDIRDLRVLCPPLAEQRAVVVDLEKLSSVVESASRSCRRGIALARERRAALISAAVTGKIDVGVAV